MYEARASNDDDTMPYPKVVVISYIARAFQVRVVFSLGCFSYNAGKGG